MKPLPAQYVAEIPVPDPTLPSHPTPLPTPMASYSSANRRSSATTAQKAYPWLLGASTALAGAFCVLYVTKPVIVASASGELSEKPAAESVRVAPVAARTGLMPDRNRLPGEKAGSGALASDHALPSNPAAPFEQTNLRVQHILTAEGPGGQLAKIDIDVPVLYQSRSLRWTAAEVAEARALLARLSDYKGKSSALRLEGADLLESWNRLIAKSIPASDLRADSPTLTTNQQDAADAPRPAGLDTAEAIKIQTAAQ